MISDHRDRKELNLQKFGQESFRQKDEEVRNPEAAATGMCFI